VLTISANYISIQYPDVDSTRIHHVDVMIYRNQSVLFKLVHV